LSVAPGWNPPVVGAPDAVLLSCRRMLSTGVRWRFFYASFLTRKRVSEVEAKLLWGVPVTDRHPRLSTFLVLVRRAKTTGSNLLTIEALSDLCSGGKFCWTKLATPSHHPTIQGGDCCTRSLPCFSWLDPRQTKRFLLQGKQYPPLCPSHPPALVWLNLDLCDPQPHHRPPGCHQPIGFLEKITGKRRGADRQSVSPAPVAINPESRLGMCWAMKGEARQAWRGGGRGFQGDLVS